MQSLGFKVEPCLRTAQKYRTSPPLIDNWKQIASGFFRDRSSRKPDGPCQNSTFVRKTPAQPEISSLAGSKRGQSLPSREVQRSRI